VTDAEALRRDIEGRYGTVHRFCRAYRELGRSTVYQLLAGRYPGNAARQFARLREILAGGPEKRRVEAVYAAIKQAACQRCAAWGKGRECSRCDGLYREQAQAALEALDEVQ
jgi:hypothetical protein